MSNQINSGSRNSTIEDPPRLYLVIANIQKRTNVINLMKAAVAFGCYEVCLVGQEKNIQQQQQQDGGGEENTNNKKKNIPIPCFYEAIRHNQIQLRRFGKWDQLVQYLHTESIFLIGVEIDKTSQPLNDEYFEKHFPTSTENIAILMGNEGDGIHPKHMKECKALIRIPQYGTGTASLNVNVAANIVLYKFQTWKQQKQKRRKSNTVANKSELKITI